AYFTLDQVATLTTDARLPAWQRLFYAFEFLTGARTGETSEMRFNDIKEDDKGGLRRIVISRSYHTRTATVKDTKTGAVKIVPEHPFLARCLREWRETGFREWT